MNYQKVIIIGAPRSGTNMLRDVLCGLPGFGTWPCDEINYIWRHGNARWPSDEFPAELATRKVATYIQRQFDRCARANDLSHLVEKTCANSLRVPFVDRALPDARYLFIHRQPIDAVASAIIRWRAPLDLRYTLRKARFVPLTDTPYYAWKFLKNRMHKLLAADHRMASWGPRIDGMDRRLGTESLAEICARQWNACVGSAAAAFREMKPGKARVIRYEDFVTAPESRLGDLCTYLGVDIRSAALARAVRSVSAKSIGKGQAQLDASTRDAVIRLTTKGLERLGEL